MADYCTVADVKNLAGATLTTDDTLLASLVTRASARVDKETQTVFESEAATRYYTPGQQTDGKTLFFDTDILTVTELVTGTETIPSDGYTLHPLNAERKRYLVLKSAYSWEYPDDLEGSITLTGTRGYMATPDADIVQLTARLALWLYRQREAPFGRVGNAITGDYETPVALPDDIDAALDNYRAKPWGVG